MHHHTTTAGYFNFALKAKLEARYPNGEARALLRQLSACHITSDIDLSPAQGPLPSEMVVLHNLVQRGMPTMPGLAVERALTALGYTKEDDRETAIDFPVTDAVNDALLDEVFTALHVADNRFEPNYSDVFESGFEASVFQQETRRHPYLRQLLTAQVDLPSLLPGENGFHRQRTDFVLPLLYPLADNDPLKPALKGFIVEVDGKSYHSSFRQQALDLKRDTATHAAGWHTRRVQERGAALQAFDEITRSDFVQRVAHHYCRPMDAAWVNVLQLALTPIAVARVQKVILDAILSGLLKADEEQWEIVVIERDVPCAQLAVDDLNTWMERLYALGGKTGAPRIVLKKVFVSREFAQARLRGQEQMIVGEYDGASCDLIVDVSVLRRYGMELNLHYPYPYAIVRSERWPWTNRRFHTARPIAYGPLATYEGERWSAIRERETQMEFFLQNLFRKKQFRQGQIPILHRALNLKTVIGLLPTGGGKSLTYQLAALLQPGITLVIDPLRSLMQDQVDNLVKLGMDACALLNSRLTGEEKRFALFQLRTGQTMMMFVSPERMMMEDFRLALQSMRGRLGFAYCVIDEVHCVSEWGHDFRTAYLALGRNATQHLPFAVEDEHVPLFGLTATASFDVLADVERELMIHDEPDAIVSAEYTSRDEIFFHVVDVSVDHQTFPLRVDDTRQFLFTVNPVSESDEWALKKTVANAKLAVMSKLIREMPEAYDMFNDSKAIEHVLRQTWREILDAGQRENQPENNWVTAKREKIQIPDYQPHQLFEAHGGLIFAPHRKWVFGVTDKFKIQIDNNRRPQSGPDGKPVFVNADQREGIADKLIIPPFNGAIPIDCRKENAGGYVGTFIGSSDESQYISDLVDKDSFRNQEWFINNQVKLMVATKAFGMGIDKPNIRYTIHFNSPSSPESFVQEAGRGGRDGSLALSYVLINRQKLFSLESAHFRLFRNAGYSLPNVDNRITGKYFHEAAFKELLENLELPPLEELRKWPRDRQLPVPFSEINVDEDILNFFQENSFRGTGVEMQFLKSLLFEPITFPGSTLKEVLEKQLEEELGLGIVLNYWEQGNRLYIKEDDGGLDFGYIDINNGWRSNGPPHAMRVHETVKLLIGAYFSDIMPDGATFRARFYTLAGQKKTPGILEYLESPQKDGFELGFINHLTKERHTNALLQFIRGHFDPNYDESAHKKLYDEAQSSNLTFEEYFERLFQDPIPFFDTPDFHELKHLWYSRRTKPDTDKAIYRLTCIGVVDDFEVDYRNETYRLNLKSKMPGEYVFSLYQYVRRYYSDSRVRKVLHEKLDSVVLPDDNQLYDGNSIVLKQDRTLKDLFLELASFVVDFAYQEIAAKRKAAIGDVFGAFNTYLDNESKVPGSGNFQLKSYLHLYFNSKYARERYTAKLDDPDTAAEYSLRDETQGGQVLEFERILDYIKLMAIDRSGNETDNIKHLRGASTRLLRSDPNNPGLRLLKAFSLFVLSWQFENTFQEACDDCEAGLTDYLHTDDETQIIALVKGYASAVETYLPRRGAGIVKSYFNDLTNMLLLKRNLHWLKGFNQHFLKDFQHQS